MLYDEVHTSQETRRVQNYVSVRIVYVPVFEFRRIQVDGTVGSPSDTLALHTAYAPLHSLYVALRFPRQLEPGSLTSSKRTSLAVWCETVISKS